MQRAGVLGQVRTVQEGVARCSRQGRQACARERASVGGVGGVGGVEVEGGRGACVVRGDRGGVGGFRGGEMVLCPVRAAGVWWWPRAPGQGIVGCTRKVARGCPCSRARLLAPAALGQVAVRRAGAARRTSQRYIQVCSGQGGAWGAAGTKKQRQRRRQAGGSSAGRDRGGPLGRVAVTQLPAPTSNSVRSACARALSRLRVAAPSRPRAARAPAALPTKQWRGGPPQTMCLMMSSPPFPTRRQCCPLASLHVHVSLPPISGRLTAQHYYYIAEKPRAKLASSLVW